MHYNAYNYLPSPRLALPCTFPVSRFQPRQWQLHTLVWLLCAVCACPGLARPLGGRRAALMVRGSGWLDWKLGWTACSLWLGHTCSRGTVLGYHGNFQEIKFHILRLCYWPFCNVITLSTDNTRYQEIKVVKYCLTLPKSNHYLRMYRVLVLLYLNNQI